MGVFSALPEPQGLYDPAAERDACGVAFVATLTGEPSHDIVAKALIALENLTIAVRPAPSLTRVTVLES